METRFPAVPFVGTGAHLCEEIAGWITSEALRTLLAALGAGTDLTCASGPTDDLVTRLARLDEFTDRWDTRGGRERNLAGELDLTATQAKLTLDVARALHLCDPRSPRRRRYDHVLTLGGLARACIGRPAYAAHLLRTGQITADAVTALGGYRPFGGDEFETAATLGISGVTEEYAALDAGTRRAFALHEPEAVEGECSDQIGGTWGVRRYRTSSGMPVLVAAAPSSDPIRRRANTADSCAWFAGYLASLVPGQSLLMVTTPIYLPAQHAAAIRMLQLPYGVTVETVGTDPAVTGGVARTPTPTRYLLEIRSTIRALRDLHSASISGQRSIR